MLYTPKIEVYTQVTELVHTHTRVNSAGNVVTMCCLNFHANTTWRTSVYALWTDACAVSCQSTNTLIRLFVSIRESWVRRVCKQKPRRSATRYHSLWVLLCARISSENVSVLANINSTRVKQVYKTLLFLLLVSFFPTVHSRLPCAILVGFISLSLSHPLSYPVHVRNFVSTFIVYTVVHT